MFSRERQESPEFPGLIFDNSLTIGSFIKLIFILKKVSKNDILRNNIE